MPVGTKSKNTTRSLSKIAERGLIEDNPHQNSGNMNTATTAIETA